jgi:uncharacterized protein (DUF1697 family)
MLCKGSDLLRVAASDPFGQEGTAKDVVRFVSVFATAKRRNVRIPLSLPAEGQWLVRLVAAEGPFVFGVYRRHMKTIGYLGKLDALYGGRATTRNWNTIQAIARVLSA